MRKYIVGLLLCFLFLNFCHFSLFPQSVNSERQVVLRKWQDCKFGMFIHWGLYSVPGGVWKGQNIPYYAEQIMNHARIDTAEYATIAAQFEAPDWNADEIVRLAKDAGMKYIVFTAKHHDGFCMFRTRTTPYNVVEATPFARDPIQELAAACKKYNLQLGLYYSLPDWYYAGGIPRNPVDTLTNCTQHINQLYSPLEQITPELENYIDAQLQELLTQYGDLVTLWFDMGLATPEQSSRFRQTVLRYQPNCLINGRLMNNQGDYYTLTDNSQMVGFSDIPWDNPASMYGTWGYRSWENRGDSHLKALLQIERLINTVSHGGVFLLNIGPDGDGKVIDFEKDVLQEMGQWIAQNQESIYATTACPFPHLKNAYCTQKDNKIYFFVRQSDTVIECRNLITKVEKAYFLYAKNKVTVTPIDQGCALRFVAPVGEGWHVLVLEFAENPIIQSYYLLPEKNNFVLTPDNGLTHAAFDGMGYVSLQNDSWKEWNLSIQTAGKYKVWIEYYPMFISKNYLFSFGNQTVKAILPGVDDVLQTAFVGTFELKEGKTAFQLQSASPCDALEPLGLWIKRVLVVGE